MHARVTDWSEELILQQLALFWKIYGSIFVLVGKLVKNNHVHVGIRY